MERFELTRPFHEVIGCEKRPRGISTLLVPVRYSRLLMQAMNREPLEVLLTRLLAGARIPARVSSTVLRTRYQEDGLDLQRFTFRVDDDVWFQLGQLARVFGVSRCRMFIALLVGRWKGHRFRPRTRGALGRRWILIEWFAKSKRRVHLKLAKNAKLRGKPPPKERNRLPQGTGAPNSAHEDPHEDY